MKKCWFIVFVIGFLMVFSLRFGPITCFAVADGICGSATNKALGIK